jgi:hypothetical protein
VTAVATRALERGSLERHLADDRLAMAGGFVRTSDSAVLDPLTLVVAKLLR